MTDEAGLTRHQNIVALVASYEVARNAITMAFCHLALAREAFDESFALGLSSMRLRIMASGYSHSEIDDEPKHALDSLKQGAWKALVERLELRRMMSTTRWEQLRKQLEKPDELPEVTVENVNAWGSEQIAALPTMLTESVQEVFEWLRPCNNEYKRNSQYEVPKSVVLKYAVDLGWNGSYAVHHDRTWQMFVALESVLNALDGKGQIAKQHKSQLQIAIEECGVGTKNRGETPLFKFACYRNKNLHLTFKRLDLLKRFNEVAGGKRLHENRETRP